MDRLETRVLEYFVTVAEELHFGRAAERLGIAQPPLSRAIARLERRVGVRLFDRTSRKVALTPAGRAFLMSSRRALTAVDVAVQRARDAARPARLRLAARPGAGTGILVDLLTTYGEDPGAVPVELLHTHDQVGALLAGAADVALICGSSTPSDQLETLELTVEQPVALVPRTHLLADRADVTIAELRRDSAYADMCPAESLDAIVDKVALGLLVVVVGDSAADRIGGSLKSVPVTDLPPSRLMLAWSPQTPNSERPALVRAARRAVKRHGLSLAVPAAKVG